ncbi:carboxymuconolactone decarboxylase family protein, partial [Clostridioides difficile]|uniref:carboxymuconolactone decarboxylase family protein n=1 Tax=Clostridioides difficile TaxID=1496 RepID=UPI001F450685
MVRRASRYTPEHSSEASDVDKIQKEYRVFYNKKLSETDEFFRVFGSLDDKTYSEGAISKKNKELMGLAISILSRCDECICYHIEGCINSGASKDEIIAV